MDVMYQNYCFSNSFLKPKNSKNFNYYCKGTAVDKFGEAYNACGKSVWTEIGFCCSHPNATVMEGYSPRRCCQALKIKGITYQDELILD